MSWPGAGGESSLRQGSQGTKTANATHEHGLESGSRTIGLATGPHRPFSRQRERRSPRRAYEEPAAVVKSACRCNDFCGNAGICAGSKRPELVTPRRLISDGTPSTLSPKSGMISIRYTDPTNTTKLEQMPFGPNASAPATAREMIISWGVLRPLRAGRQPRRGRFPPPDRPASFGISGERNGPSATWLHERRTSRVRFGLALARPETSSRRREWATFAWTVRPVRKRFT